MQGFARDEREVTSGVEGKGVGESSKWIIVIFVRIEKEKMGWVVALPERIYQRYVQTYRDGQEYAKNYLSSDYRSRSRDETKMNNIF